MTSIRSSQLPWLIGAVALSVALGTGVAFNRQIAFVALVVLLGVAATAAPASAWVGAALVAALTFKGLVSLGVLPSVATFVDLPLAWGALFVALLKGGEHSPLLRRHLRWLAALACATALAWAFNPSEVLRPVVYLMLLAEPFVIIGALLADPPTPRLRLALEYLLLGLLVIQIPLVAFDLSRFGYGSDNVQGTLYGAGAGAHVVSAICVVGAIWVLSGGIARRVLGRWRYFVVALLFVIPFIADAKQVIVALPVIVLAFNWHGDRRAVVVGSFVAVASFVALFTLAPGGKVASVFLGDAQSGQSGKKATALFLWHKLDEDPAALAFGKGPAETVSRAAFMTTPFIQNADSPLAALNLEPASIAVEAEQTALSATAHVGGRTSFNSGMSSTLGVLGDLGLFGLAVYLGLFLSLFLRLRMQTSPESVAAAAGFALLLALGLVFDWWEQPPVFVFVAVLAGLGLAGAPRESGRAVHQAR